MKWRQMTTTLLHSLSQGFASFCGFLASSALVSEDSFKRNMISLTSGFLGVLATTITSLRNSAKYDVKAEMFRGAAGQYRLLSTRLEERMRSVSVNWLSVLYVLTFALFAAPYVTKWWKLERREGTQGGHSGVQRLLPRPVSSSPDSSGSHFSTLMPFSFKMTLFPKQSEMKYFPPVAAVREWKKSKQLLPSEVDQPEVDRVDQAALLEQLESIVWF